MNWGGFNPQPPDNSNPADADAKGYTHKRGCIRKSNVNCNAIKGRQDKLRHLTFSEALTRTRHTDNMQKSIVNYNNNLCRY